MTQDDIIFMARASGWLSEYESSTGFSAEAAIKFAALIASAEREACEALHDHEDVQAPVGNSSWGEAYQEGWGQGTAAYRDAIKARGQA
jgi:hypothetical protein